MKHSQPQQQPVMKGKTMITIDPEIEKIQLRRNRYLTRAADALMAGAGTAGDVLEHNFSGIAMSDELQRAFDLAFPGKDPGQLSGLDIRSRTGLINAWKGKYFEVLAVDQLNEAGQIGELTLEAGQSAVLSDFLNQPGWDIQIVNEDGSIADLIQLKATDSLSYVRLAAEQYPDIPILVTTEISGEPDFICSGLSDQELTQSVSAAVDHLNAPFWLNVATDALQVLPFAMIAFWEIRQAIQGNKSFLRAANDAVIRSTKTAVVRTVCGWILLTGAGFATIPVSVIGRALLDRVECRLLLHRMINKVTASLRDCMRQNTHRRGHPDANSL